MSASDKIAEVIALIKDRMFLERGIINRVVGKLDSITEDATGNEVDPTDRDGTGNEDTALLGRVVAWMQRFSKHPKECNQTNMVLCYCGRDELLSDLCDAIDHAKGAEDVDPTGREHTRHGGAGGDRVTDRDGDYQMVAPTDQPDTPAANESLPKGWGDFSHPHPPKSGTPVPTEYERGLTPEQLAKWNARPTPDPRCPHCNGVGNYLVDKDLYQACYCHANYSEQEPPSPVDHRGGGRYGNDDDHDPAPTGKPWRATTDRHEKPMVTYKAEQEADDFADVTEPESIVPYTGLENLKGADDEAQDSSDIVDEEGAEQDASSMGPEADKEDLGIVADAELREQIVSACEPAHPDPQSSMVDGLVALFAERERDWRKQNADAWETATKWMGWLTCRYYEKADSLEKAQAELKVAQEMTEKFCEQSAANRKEADQLKREVERERKVVIPVLQKTIAACGDRIAELEADERKRKLEEGSWPWCESCNSYHHPDNTSCLTKETYNGID